MIAAVCLITRRCPSAPLHQVEVITTEIANRIRNGEVIYVHCQGGHGYIHSPLSLCNPCGFVHVCVRVTPITYLCASTVRRAGTITSVVLAKLYPAMSSDEALLRVGLYHASRVETRGYLSPAEEIQLRQVHRVLGAASNEPMSATLLQPYAEATPSPDGSVLKVK